MADSSSPRGLWSAQDRRILAQLVLGSAASLVIPKSRDRALLGALARWRRDRPPGPVVAELEDRMRFALDRFRPEADYGAMAWEAWETLTELSWLRARALRGRSVEVETSVEGLEHMGEKGALLWGMSFCGTLVVKIALHRAGHPLVHLSTEGHGGAEPLTRMGYTVVSPLYCVPENRFLRERVVIPLDGSLGYMRDLLTRLHDGLPVYIAGERLAPRRNTTAECLGRPTSFARGAPGLAYRTSAPLLPVSVYRDGPLRYRVVIEPAVPPPDPRQGRGSYVAGAVQAFADRVTRNVLEHPTDWDWFRHTIGEWRAQEPDAGASP